MVMWRRTVVRMTVEVPMLWAMAGMMPFAF
jgi:hypothetical protein